MNPEFMLFSRQHFPMALSTVFLYLVTLWVYLISTLTGASSETLTVSTRTPRKVFFFSEIE